MFKKLKDRFNAAAETRRRKSARRPKRKITLKRFLLVSTALSTLIHFAPDIASKPVKDWLQDRDLPADTAQYYTTKNIRIYDRYNPLFPFALAERAAVLSWKDGRKDGDNILSLAINIPLGYASGLSTGFLTMLTPTSLDAFTLLDDSLPVSERECYIRPQGNVGIKDLMTDFTGLRMKGFKTTASPEKLAAVFQQYVIAHEMRHCDQNHSFNASSLNEADADIYALRVVGETAGQEVATLEEAKTILRHLRSLNSMTGDTHHASTFALDRTHHTPMDAHEDTAVFNRLSGLLKDGYSINNGAFKDMDLKRAEEKYHVAVGMMKAGIFKDEKLKEAAQSFIDSVEFFDEASGGKVITKRNLSDKLNFDAFTREYVPVPDKTPSKKEISAAAAKSKFGLGA